MSDIVKNNENYNATFTTATRLETKTNGKITGVNVLDRSTRPEVDESSTGLLRYIKANGLGIGAGRVTQQEKYEKFARYERLDPHNWLGTTREYIFFTSPDLQIFNNNIASRSPLFAEAITRYSNVVDSLCYTRTNKPFVNLLSNYKRSNVDLPDISASSDYETSKNILGSSIFYRGTSYESDENHEFSIEFEDTKYLEVYMWFRLFDEYERMKHYGLITEINPDYINKKIIHDQMAMYKFIVGDDGESIIHYSKYYGVYPKNVPRGTFSDLPADGNIKFTINFKASFVDDMDPNIIYDFNYLSQLIPRGNPNTGGYMDEFNGWSGEFMQRPYIEMPGNSSTTNQDVKTKDNEAGSRRYGKDLINSSFTKFDSSAKFGSGYNELLPNRGFYKLKWEG